MPVQPGNHSIGGLAVNFDRIRERTVSMVALNPVNRTVRGMPRHHFGRFMKPVDFR